MANCGQSVIHGCHKYFAADGSNFHSMPKRKDNPMSTPKGMKCSNRKLTNGDRVLIYSDREQIVLQIRHQTPTEENLLDSSFKVAVALSPADALLIASEL